MLKGVHASKLVLIIMEGLNMLPVLAQQHTDIIIKGGAVTPVALWTTNNALPMEDHRSNHCACGFAISQ